MSSMHTMKGSKAIALAALLVVVALNVAAEAAPSGAAPRKLLQRTQQPAQQQQRRQQPPVQSGGVRSRVTTASAPSWQSQQAAATGHTTHTHQFSDYDGYYPHLAQQHRDHDHLIHGPKRTTAGRR